MMKNLARIALAVICFAPAIASAQNGGIALKGGLSYGNVSNGGLLPGDTKRRSGYVAGLSVTTGGLIGIGFDALYAQRGVTSATAGDSRRLDYIDVPLYLRVALPLGPVQPFVYAGPQASYELKCGTDGVDCPDTDRDKFTFSGVIGAGLRLGSGTGISLEGRYLYGLKDLHLSTVTTSDSYRTRSFMILLGIGF